MSGILIKLGCIFRDGRSGIGRTFAAFAVAIGVLTTFNAAAQTASTFDTGTITGAITDPSGAVIPHASVTIVNTGTGNTINAVTNNEGIFSAPGLPFGNYVVTASASQFSKTTTRPFALNVGATVRVDLKLSVAAATENVTVTGTSVTVDTSSATAGTTMNEDQIRNLPTNGRDVMDFLEIAPGSINSTGYFQGSVNGQENFLTGLNVTLDGQNSTRPDVNGFDETEGNEANRLTRASIDSIQEIDFANSGYSAEVGDSLGPQMNIVTKGGTNEFHGEMFDFFRNDALDANDYFANTLTSPKVPLRMNQFGANLGGPLVRNKLFFFASYEGIRQRTTQINALYEIPSAYVRSQFDAAMQPVLAQMAPLPADCTAIPAPASCAVPFTTDTNSAEGADLVYDPAAFTTTLREDSGAIRVDYNMGDKDRIFVRFNIDNGLTNQELGLNQGQTTPLSDINKSTMIDETHTFTPNLVNELSVAFHSFYSNTNSDTSQPFTQFGGFFTNLGSLPGAPNSFNQINPQSKFEIFDNATKTASSHTIRFGTHIQFNRIDELLRPLQDFAFGSFSALENDQPFVLQKIGFPNFVGVRNSNWDLYAEDDWRATSKLTLNAGLRTGINTAWSFRDNVAPNFDAATQSFLPATQTAYQGPTYDVAPRLGLNFDPFGHGKTVIHAYYGLFFNPMHFGTNLVSNNPAYESYSVNAFEVPLAYPMQNPTLPAGTQNVYSIPRSMHDPYSPNWLVGIQQEILHNTVLTVNYTGNEDHRQDAGIDFAAENLNAPNYFTQAYPMSGFANEYYEPDELQSDYNALQVQLRHNVGKLNVEANYTWSHEIDDMVNVFNSYSDPVNPRDDFGNGDWDVRQNVTGSVVYNFTDLNGHSALMRTVLGGWQTSTIVQARSGDTINVTDSGGGIFGLSTRPNYTGQPVRLSNFSWPYHTYNVAAYEVPADFNGTPGDPSTLGNVGRNNLRGPGFVQWDFSGMKNFPLTEKVKLQFRGDLFNILNHPNFGNPSVGVCSSISSPIPPTGQGCTPTVVNGQPEQEVNAGFGEVGSTIADQDASQVGTGTARQIQLALKVIF
jgi:Carboxypeptidase regulatory-like domain/TonB dependent receptor